MNDDVIDYTALLEEQERALHDVFDVHVPDDDDDHDVIDVSGEVEYTYAECPTCRAVMNCFDSMIGHLGSTAWYRCTTCQTAFVVDCG